MSQNRNDDKNNPMEILRNYRKQLESLGGLDELEIHPELLSLVDEYTIQPNANCGR